MNSINNLNIIHIIDDFYYNSNFDVLICKKCEYCVTNSGLNHHLFNYHKDLILNDRKNIESICKNYTILSQENVQIPEFFKYKFPYLKIYNNLFSCNSCEFAINNLKSIGIHLKNQHNINKKELGINYSNNQIGQCFFNRKLNQKYFLIRLENNEINLFDNNSIELTINNEITKFQQTIKSFNENKINNSIDFNINEISAGVKRSKIYLYIQNKDLDSLLLLLNKPDLNNNINNEYFEQKLQILYNLVINLLYNAENITANLSSTILNKLNSENQSPKIIDIKPFKVLQNKQSKRKYYAIFAEIFIYLIRFIWSTTEFNQPILSNTIIEKIIDIMDILNYIENIENIQNINDNNDEEISKIRNAIEIDVILIFHELLTQKFDQIELDKNIIFNNTIYTFFALKNIDVNTKSFKSDFVIENLTSFIIYDSRAFCLLYLNYLYDKNTEINQTTDLNQEFNYIYDNYLKNDSNNYFCEIVLLRAYLRKINANSTAQNRIYKISNNLIKYESIELNINKLKEFFNILYQNAFELLLNNLLFIKKNKISADLNLNNLKNIPSNNNNDFSFLNHNDKLRKFDNFLLKRLYNSNDKLSQSLGKIENNQYVFDNNKLNIYLNNRELFLKYLLLLLHLFSGPPVRETEIITLKIKNESFKLNRNIYIDEKTHLFYAIIYYHKNLSISNIYSRNIKFFSSEISRLLLLYLVIEYPFYQYLLAKNQPQNLNTINYLFEAKNTIFSSELLGRFLREQSLIHLNHEISILPFRHLLIYIIREFIDNKFENNNNNSDSTSNNKNIVDINANHSTRTANLTYARDQNLARNIRSDKIKKTREFMIKYFNYYEINKYRVFSKKHTRQTSSINSINIRPAKKPQLNININKDDYEMADISDTKFLKIKQKIENRKLLQEKSNNNDLKTELLKLYSNIPNINLNEVDFRLNQKKTILEILNKTPCITYINGTGSSKSLLFLLPAFIEKNIINIIITPLVSLKYDMIEKYKKFNLNAVIFEHENQQNFDTNLIFISIESIKNINFINYINKLQAGNTEFRIFFDEIHLIITQSNFRYIIKYVSEINLFRVNLIFLTATFPDKIQELIELKIKIRFNKLIRNNVTKNNIKYQIIELQRNQNEIIELKNYAFTRLKEIDINDKIIIYITTTNLCDYIAKELNCLKYYANFDDKENHFDLFKNNSKHRLMVATNALGLGIDLYFIREVIHIFKQYKIIDYFQEGGRAARDNNKGVNTLFIKKELYAKSFVIDGTKNEFELFEKIDKNKLIKYINEPVCRRRVLENYFNNNTVNKCEND